jgi:AP-3 complex subunit beta
MQVGSLVLKRVLMGFQVVMAVTRAFYYLALSSHHHKIVRPLLRLLAVSPEVERVILTYILFISQTSSVRFHATPS